MATAIKDVNIRFNCKKEICLAAAVVADTGAPSLATDGVAMYETESLGQGSTRWEPGANFPRQPIIGKHRLCIKGSSTPSAKVVLWGYLKSASAWFPIAINGGTNVFATTTTYTELIDGLSHFDRVALDIDWTSGSVEAWLVTCTEIC